MLGLSLEATVCDRYEDQREMDPRAGTLALLDATEARAYRRYGEAPPTPYNPPP
jgi:hypothetical protein